MKIRILGLKTSETPTAYKVQDGVLYINEEPIEVDLSDGSVASYDHTAIEGAEYLTREEVDEEVTLGLKPTVTREVSRAVFTTYTGSPSIFPSHKEDGKTIWEATLEQLEGMEW